MSNGNGESNGNDIFNDSIPRTWEGLPANCAALSGPPDYEQDLEAWTKWAFISNCYNYATGVLRGTPSNPGEYRGDDGHLYWPSGDVTKQQCCQCAYVLDGCRLDGLRLLSDTWDDELSCDDENCHMIALLVEPGEGYHFLRRDSDGKWSDKPGKLEPRRATKNGQEITDPNDWLTRDNDQFGVEPSGDWGLCGILCVCKCNAHPPWDPDKTAWRERQDEQESGGDDGDDGDEEGESMGFLAPADLIHARCTLNRHFGLANPEWGIPLDRYSRVVGRLTGPQLRARLRDADFGAGAIIVQPSAPVGGLPERLVVGFGGVRVTVHGVDRFLADTTGTYEALLDEARKAGLVDDACWAEDRLSESR